MVAKQTFFFKGKKEDLLGYSDFLLWNMWRARNKCFFEDLKPDPNKTLYSCNRSWTERRKILQPKWQNSSLPNPEASKEVFWKAPKENFLKLNTDRSFIKASRADFGDVIRNHLGQVFAVSYGPCVSSTPFQAEVIACIKGVSLANNYISRPIILESNNRTLIQVLRLKDLNLAKEAYFLCKDLLSICEGVISDFCFCKQEL
uniref:RNase H type-1 domain-containing protein n=1 Tax=Nelumbo nucifera TaxID=4432 RepID=A0A822ZMN8_NELNU|nr:TPA_asm: hypothetical protein HUJ06_016419 [Nelumbo nucifera]